MFELFGWWFWSVFEWEVLLGSLWNGKGGWVIFGECVFFGFCEIVGWIFLGDWIDVRGWGRGEYEVWILFELYCFDWYD